MNLIELSNVVFSYDHNTTVLKDINLSVPKGIVYGFLGGNGQGKSTTLKLILGLLKPSSGRISIFWQDIASAYPKSYKQIGSLVESASLYEHLNARQHLSIWSQFYDVPKPRISGVLDFVGLLQVGKKRIGNYSTGMKQRLGLATALLHNPEVLILDEPTNGLDPQGIIELRKIINNLKEQGKTIIISSHILSEVEKIVDKIGIIKDGEIVFEGSIEQLEKLQSSLMRIAIKVDNSTKALSVLQNREVNLLGNNEIQVLCSSEQDISEIIAQLNKENIKVFSVSNESNNLEDLFLTITKN